MPTPEELRQQAEEKRKAKKAARIHGKPADPEVDTSAPPVPKTEPPTVVASEEVEADAAKSDREKAAEEKAKVEAEREKMVAEASAKIDQEEAPVPVAATEPSGKEIIEGLIRQGRIALGLSSADLLKGTTPKVAADFSRVIFYTVAGKRTYMVPEKAEEKPAEA